jgi:3-oxoacyl-[acyl-carrier protein] reductase
MFDALACQTSHTSLRLDGKVVIVTGGGNGIGLVTAAAIAQAGGRVAIADVDAAAAESAVRQIAGSGAEASPHRVDVAEEASTDKMARAVLARYGRIDGLVNNAALMATLPRRPWHEIPVEEWDRVMAVNLRGLFLCSRAVWPALAKCGSGAIVNLSSNRAFDGTPNRLHYTTSKGGVVGFTRALARELGPDNIRVNAVAPGLTLSERQLETSTPEYLAQMAQGRALTRPQTPSDLVGAILFLLSPASSYITGQTLTVDGGKIMR